MLTQLRWLGGAQPIGEFQSTHRFGVLLLDHVNVLPFALAATETLEPFSVAHHTEGLLTISAPPFPFPHLMNCGVRGVRGVR